MVVLVDGVLTLYVERGGKTMLAWTNDPETGGSSEPDGTETAADPGAGDEGAARLVAAVEALADATRRGALGTLTVERVNGSTALTSPLGKALEAAGFHPTPRGLRLRAG